MRILAALLAFVMLVNIVTPKPVPLSMTYSIYINKINPKDAAAGNSNNVTLDISINQFGKFLCGLTADNFIIDTLNKPADGHDATIYSVGGSFASREGSPLCNYKINIAPISYQDKQYLWVKGNYTFEIDYVRNERELANESFNLIMA
jgi:hypothetical protein